MPSPAWIPHHCSLLLAATLLALTTAGALAQDPGQDPGQDPPTAPPRQAIQDGTGDPERLVALLSDPEGDPEARLKAAQTLLSPGGGRDRVSDVTTLMAQDTGPGSGARFLLRAMASRGVVPGEFWPALSALSSEDDPELRVLLARAAASFRSRDAAELLVELAERDPDPSVRDAASGALTRLSGRAPAGGPGAWDAWLREQGSVDGLAWLRGLIEGLSGRADELARRLESAEAQLVATNRRLHLALPPEQRSSLLASLLRDPIPRLRQLGFELVDRELASSTELEADVGRAAIELLDAPDPLSRRRAALLVTRLSPADGAEAVAARLRIETDQGVAEALLRGIARWPAPGLSDAVCRWALEDTPARRWALSAAWSMWRAGYLRDERAQVTLRSALRERPAGELGVSALRLLAALGEDTDLTQVRGLLSSEDAETRRRAAEALAQDAGSVDLLLSAASRDPALFDLAAESLGAHRADAGGLLALVALRAPTPEQGAAGVQALSERLSLAQLVEACAEIPDPALRERLLVRALVAEDSPERRSGVVLLAAARLDQGRAADTLQALDALTPSAEAPTPQEIELRAASLVALGRTDEAAPLGATPDAWLRGLELSIGTAQARAVLEALTARFEGELSPEQEARLALLRQSLADAESSGEGSGAGDGAP